MDSAVTSTGGVALPGAPTPSAVPPPTPARFTAPRRDRRWLRNVRRSVLGVVVLALAVPAWITVNIVTTGSDADTRPAQALIVLGATQYDGRPQDYFKARLDHAADLFTHNVAPLVVTVGGRAPGDRFSEAEAGRDYLVKQGVPVAALLAVSEGRDTWGSLVAADKVLRARGITRVLVVSDPWHMFRSESMGRSLGWDTTGNAVTTGPSVDAANKWPYVVRELGAYLSWRYVQLTG